MKRIMLFRTVSLILVIAMLCGISVYADAGASLPFAAAFGAAVFNRKITVKMMNPELRVIGGLMSLFVPSMSKPLFRLSNFVLDNFGRGVDMTGKDIEYKQEYIERDNGSLLRICVYTPRERKDNVPGLLWIHGGGYAIGIPEVDYKFIEDFILASGCVVVAPDYTNSTDAPYPAALDDCYAALIWLKEHSAEYGVQSDQLFVGGDSAGGGLTAAVSLRARDRGDVSIAFQMPLYPMLDDRMITESSQGNDAPMWDSESNENAWKLYLGDDYGTDRVSKYAAPSRETDYSGLPPTLTYVGTIEPFTDETVKYVEDLRNAGVEVSFRLYEGCFHAFDTFGFTNIAKDAKTFLLDGFMYAVEHYSKPQ